MQHREQSSETLTAESPATVTMYTTAWCGDCRRAKRYLDEWRVAFVEVNIEEVDGAAEMVMAWANGRRVVPTIVVGDQVLVNPSRIDLGRALGTM